MLIVNVLIACRQTLTTATLEWTLRAVGSLARRSDSNKQSLANHGACEVIMKIVMPSTAAAPAAAGVADLDLTSPAVAEAACWAIGNLAYPDENNQDRLRYSSSAPWESDVLREV
jgi:hypothetical protein